MSSTDGVFGHQVVTGLRAADDDLAKAVLAPVWQAADADVETAVELLDRIEAKAAAMRSMLLVQAEERSLRERTGAPSTSRWLVERFRWSRSRAQAAISEARTLAERPVVAAALADGAVTTEQATAVTEALARIDRVPGATVAEREDAAHFLIEHAAALGPKDLTTVGRQLEETLTRLPSVDNPDDEEALAREQERAEREPQARERNAFRFSRGRDGRCRATLDLGPVGEAFARDWAKGAGRRGPRNRRVRRRPRPVRAPRRRPGRPPRPGGRRIQSHLDDPARCPRRRRAGSRQHAEPGRRCRSVRH